MKAKTLGITAMLVVLIAVIGSMWADEETIETNNQAGPGDAIEQSED